MARPAGAAGSTSGLPTVVVGVPYHRGPPMPFVQSLVALLERSHRVTLTVRVAYAQAAAVHIAREHLVRHFLGQPDADYLVMVDDDQVFTPEGVERLVAWGKPLVAPLIVTRLQAPKPVAYRREGTDLRGVVQYRSLVDECWAYLAQFDPQRLAVPAGVLPQEPDHPATARDVPDDVRAGLTSPLLAVDAVGGGLVCVSRACVERIDPGPDDRYFDWEHGGEDLSFCRRVKASGQDVFVDRGCLVGHLTEYARGAVDLGNHVLQSWATEEAVRIRDAGDLAEALASDGARPSRGPWEVEPLPEVPEVPELAGVPG